MYIYTIYYIYHVIREICLISNRSSSLAETLLKTKHKVK